MAEQDTSGSPLLIGLALVGAPVFIVVLLLLVLGGGATPPPSPCGPGGSSPGVGTLRVAGIPAAYVPIIQKAGTVSPEFPAPVIAAQLQRESGFSDPTSSTGAEGPAQFEPATWTTWGKDTTGKGYADVHNPSDAIDAQARFDAALAGQVKTAQAAGQIHSSASVTEMALGAYNAGFGAVLASGGIPQNSQTMAYVPRIMTLARTTFSDAGTITAPAPDAGAPPAADAGGTGTQASTGCGGVGGQVAVHQVDYPVPGGGTQPADLYVPAGAGPGTPARPIIVMVHGGGYLAGNRSELGDAAKAAATHGYLVLNISYDLTAPRWPRQLQQVDAAIDYVRAQGTAQGIDPTRVGLLGDSAGAGLVLEAGLLGDHHGVAAVVSWSGPTDFTSLSAQVTPGDTYQAVAAVADPTLFLGCPLLVCPDLWRQASPALSVTPGAPPTMLVNSEHELVPLGQVTEMSTALDRVGAASKTLVFPGGVHANGYTAQAIGPSLDFLDASLHFTPPPPPAGGGGGGPVAQLAVAAARTQLGATYIWGGGDQNGPTGGGFDCSGLVLYAYHQAGSGALHGARTAQAQYAATASTRLPGGFNPSSYQPGDLLFYGTADNIHHVAMAIGGGQLIQASTFGEPLNITPIYNGDFFAATRPLGTPGGAPQ